MFTSFFFLALAINSIIATNYCDKSLCPPNKKHIACNNNGKLSSQCPKIAEVVDLSSFKDLIVDAHNSYRNKIATGNQRPYMAAARMATLTWDNELAKMATLNVKRCKFQHDDCRNTEKFRASGQNLFTMWSSGDRGVEAVVQKFVSSWYSEYKDANNDLIKKFIPIDKIIGHFIQMVVDKNDKIGCGLVKTVEGSRTYYYLACNYGVSHMKYQPVYEFGQAASKCTSGKNPKYPGLCSVKEKYD